MGAEERRGLLSLGFQKSFLLVVALLLAGAAKGQNWTVQTVAFRNYQQARGVVDQLQALGFSAYSQFAMSDGKQYARVRVGCFTSKAGAEALAENLKGHVTKEAVALPAADIPDTIPCVRYDLGFRLPTAWGVAQQDAHLILFWVQVAGRKGYVAYGGNAWHVVQDADQLASLEPDWKTTVTPSVAAFSVIKRQGVTFIEATPATGRSEIIAAGKLIWQSSYAAVMQAAGELVALSLANGTSISP